MGVDLSILSDSKGSPFGSTLRNPYSGINCSPKGEQTVDVAVMQEEDRIKTWR